MSTKNKIIIIIAIIAAIAFSAYYYIFIYSSNNHRQVQSETGIVITSDSLVAKYQADEKLANSLYLNKAVVVTGVLLSIDKNQEGKTTLVIGRSESFSNVSVTMTSNTPITQKVGESITIKGLCTGALSDVVITDGVVE
jgi:ABC-type glycerol-3-phosphate transport system permease component